MFADIAVVDSGTDRNSISENICGFGFKDIKCENSFIDKIGHGTAIYNLIRQHNKNAELCIIKITEREETTEEMVLHALNYILQHIECNVINLTLSSTTKKEELYVQALFVFSV